MNVKPLVSCVIITYNSANYIIEALESVKKQSYPYIELIISDDFSNDNTISICNNWIDNNKDRFINVTVISSNINTGTASNCNRGLQQCKGDWVKFFAGDDILLENCIDDLISYANTSKEITWIVGKSIKYNKYISEDCLMDSETVFTKKRLSALNGDEHCQKIAIYSYNFIQTVASFVKTEQIRAIGGFSEEYYVLEDWPLFKHLIENGVKCYFLDKYIVGYRYNENNIFSVSHKLYNMKYMKSLYLFAKNELCQHHNVLFSWGLKMKYQLCTYYENHDRNNNLWYNRYSYRFISKILNIICPIV